MTEAAWTYRLPARIGRALLDRNDAVDKTVREIVWGAQVRLCARYRRLSAAGKPPQTVVRAAGLYLGDRAACAGGARIEAAGRKDERKRAYGKGGRRSSSTSDAQGWGRGQGRRTPGRSMSRTRSDARL